MTIVSPSTRLLDVKPLAGGQFMAQFRTPRPYQKDHDRHEDSVKNPVGGFAFHFYASYRISEVTNQVLRNTTKPGPIHKQSFDEFIHGVAPVVRVINIKLRLLENSISGQFLANFWKYGSQTPPKQGENRPTFTLTRYGSAIISNIGSLYSTLIRAKVNALKLKKWQNSAEIVAIL